MMERIVVLDTGYPHYEVEKEIFRSNGYQLDVYGGDKADTTGKMAFSRDAVGIMIRWTEINEQMLDRMPNLRAIVRYGTGYENVDLEACRKAGIRVSNVQGYGNHSVSDHALGLMYACSRGLPAGIKKFKEIYGKPPFERVFEFHTKTLGIVGLGRIGGTLATKAVHLFKKVIAHDPYVEEARFHQLGVETVTYGQLLAESDVISFHCNLTEETTNMLNPAAFLKLLNQPIIINTARGPIIDLRALINAADQSLIHSAGIDVFNSEIPEQIPEELIRHPKIITTGHYAWYSEKSLIELQRRAADNMVRLLKGEQIEDSLN